MNYVDAVAYCAENEAKLFEPSYKREEMKVIDFYSDSKFKSYWLGATDSTKEGRYVTLINYLCTESILIKHLLKIETDTNTNQMATQCTIQIG